MQVYFRLLNKCGGTGSKADSGIVRGTFRKIFGKYLFLTNTLTCGGLMAVGDAIQQETEIHRGKHKGSSASMRYDWDRINRMFWVGLAQGPPQHVFYKWLDRIVPKRDFPSIMKKIILDQLIASPMCLVIFFFGLGLFERHEVTRIISEMKSKFLTIYTVDWMVWPPVQMINFYYLPPKYRVIYINIVTMLYDVFLSYVKHDVEYSNDYYILQLLENPDDDLSSEADEFEESFPPSCDPHACIGDTETKMVNRIRDVKLKSDNMSRGESHEYVRSDEKDVVVEWKDSQKVIMVSTCSGIKPEKKLEDGQKQRENTLTQTAHVLFLGIISTRVVLM